jgi:hypothetical protein
MQNTEGGRVYRPEQWNHHDDDELTVRKSKSGAIFSISRFSILRGIFFDIR